MSLWYFSEWLARDLAFPAGRFGSWVFIQYYSVVFVIFFVTLTAFGSRIRKFLYGDAEQIVGRERRERVSQLA
jgi:hypothetical protein